MLGTTSVFCVDPNMSAQFEVLRCLWGCPPDAEINMNSRYNNLYSESARPWSLVSAYSQIASSQLIGRGTVTWTRAVGASSQSDLL
jgi:hypothetical protein